MIIFAHFFVLLVSLDSSTKKDYNTGRNEAMKQNSIFSKVMSWCEFVCVCRLYQGLEWIVAQIKNR